MKRLKLDELTVTSFVTGSTNNAHTIKGAAQAAPEQAGSFDIPSFDFPTVNDSCFSWCADMCNDYPSGNCPPGDPWTAREGCTYHTCPKW